MGVVEQVSVSRLVPAAWNFKTNGTKDEISRLTKSIEADGSSGVWAVRELPGRSKKLEVMDGNHRLDAVRLLGWQEQWVENFGKLSDAEAASIAVRRNEQWFEPDPIKLSRLMTDVVLQEWPAEEFAEMTAHTLPELKAMEELGSWDWTSVPSMRRKVAASAALTMRLDEDQAKAWLEWKVRHGVEDDAEALMLAIEAKEEADV